jgi:hypothetical protein
MKRSAAAAELAQQDYSSTEREIKKARTERHQGEPHRSGGADVEEVKPANEEQYRSTPRRP